jgi:hypothetical protein
LISLYPCATGDGQVGKCVAGFIKYIHKVNWTGLVVRSYRLVKVTLRRVESVFPRKNKDRVCRAIFLLGALNPICAKLDGDLPTLGAKPFTLQTTAEFVPSLDDEEVVDTLLVQSPCRNYACDTSAKDEDGPVVGSGRRRSKSETDKDSSKEKTERTSPH